MYIVKAILIALLIAAAYAGLAFLARSVPFDEQLLRDAALVFAPAIIIQLMVAVWDITRLRNNSGS